MKTFDWKDKYFNMDGVDVTTSSKYVSLLGTGLGSREIPYKANSSLTFNGSLIIGNGVYTNLSNSISGRYSSTFIGQGKSNTILNPMITSSNANGTGSNTYYANFRDVTLKGFTAVIGGSVAYKLSILDCILDNMVLIDRGSTQSLLNAETHLIVNTIQKGKVYVRNTTNYLVCRQNTFVDIEMFAEGNYAINTGSSLFNRCTFVIDATSLTYSSKYNAFNKCLFRIGNEATATALTGTTEAQLRASFVSRCEAQGLTVPVINDYGTDVKVGRWIFSANSINGDYTTITDSEVDKFAKFRGIYLGHTADTAKVIPITSTVNTPASINTQTPSNKVNISNDSITLQETDITKRVDAYADSKIIWLGGLYKLTDLGIANNLTQEAGVSADSSFAFSPTPIISGSIEVGRLYIVRSADANVATVKYNNVVYSSSILLRTNVFLGVTGQTTFTTDTGNPQVFQALDVANHQSVQARLMRELPSGNITTGNLQAGYWYFVEPNNLADTTGTITYKGVARPAFDSFLVDAANLTFTVNGTCHLRRCWKQDFDFATETTDKAFWTDRQKPIYFDVLPDDLRCLLKGDSSTSVEMKVGDDGKYIASGHVDFYNSINGVTGFRSPAYDIVGSFLQLRIPITTINPM